MRHVARSLLVATIGIMLTTAAAAAAQAADFKLRALVQTGEPAPGGGSFTLIDDVATNKTGDLFFTADTTVGQGIFVSDQLETTLLSRTVVPAGYVPDPSVLGYTKTACPFDPQICAIIESNPVEFFRTPEGNTLLCSPLASNALNMQYVNSRPTVTDSRDIFSDGVLVRFGNMYIPWSCVHDDIMSQVPTGMGYATNRISKQGMTNSGTIYGFYDPQNFSFFQDGIDVPLFFEDFNGLTIINGIVGTTIAPGATVRYISIVRANERGQLLIFDSRGVSLAFFDGSSWAPITTPGTPAGPGKLFIGGGGNIRSLELNDNGQILFSAPSQDSSARLFSGLYRREANGQLTILAEVPGSFYGTNLRSMRMNDRGEVVAVVNASFFGPDLLYFDLAGQQSRVAGFDTPIPGGLRIAEIKAATINGAGDILFVASLSNGQTGVLVASKASAVTLTASIEGRGEEPTQVAQGQTKIARVPLGSTLRLKVQRDDGTPLPSAFTLGAASLNPSLQGPTLFGNNVAIMFDRNSLGSEKDLRAIHLGTVNLNIVPQDATISPVTVSIQVIRPDRLGSIRPEYDSLFIEYANRKGIPPQVLKGIARRESGPNFRADAYRYEPIFDYRSVSFNRSGDLRLQNPYSRFLLKTRDGLAQGTGMSLADISVRSQYFIRRIGDAQPRALTDTDEFVSALEILVDNDGLMGQLATHVPAQNWLANTDPATRSAIVADPDEVDFTAQTTIAASYGLMQVMYTTAIRPMGWTGLKVSPACDIDPIDCNPRYLFDIPPNLQLGGGTIELASELLRKGFIENNSGVSLIDPTYLSKTTLDQDHVRMLRKYNRNPSYGPSIVNQYAPMFPPIFSGNIFQ